MNDGYCKQYIAWLWIKQKGYPIVSSVSSIYKTLSSIKKRLRKNNPKIFYIVEASGSTFTGYYKHNKPHKIGVFTWKDGRKYLGEWSYGEMQGIGKFSWPNGRKYLGFWEGSLRHGFGVMHYRSGIVYEGYFDHDRPEGGGVLF